MAIPYRTAKFKSANIISDFGLSQFNSRQYFWQYYGMLLTYIVTLYHTVIIHSGWLSPDDDPLGYVQRIDQRIEDITGLTMSTAEQLQVVNYGIGGYYEPHYDFVQVRVCYASIISGISNLLLIIYSATKD